MIAPATWAYWLGIFVGAALGFVVLEMEWPTWIKFGANVVLAVLGSLIVSAFLV